MCLGAQPTDMAKELWLAQLGVDQGDFRRGECAAREGCELSQAGVDTKPLAEFLPGGLLLELWEVQLGEF